jgi:hypothetical protein
MTTALGGMWTRFMVAELKSDWLRRAEIAWYRAGVKTGGFTSGTATVTLAGNSGIDYTPTR